jgi:hypothetical protein
VSELEVVMSFERFDLKSPRKRKDGKTWWVTVGSLFLKDGEVNDATIVLDALPLPDEAGEVRVKVYKPRDAQGGARSAGAADDAW